jgi:hypothetical protein
MDTLIRRRTERRRSRLIRDRGARPARAAFWLLCRSAGGGLGACHKRVARRLVPCVPNQEAALAARLRPHVIQ